MGIPVGLSNFTSSFMQAYQGTKDKQDQDARQAAQDEMNKQQFNLQQQARQLDIDNAIKAGQEHDTDRQRALGLQQQGDLDAQSLRTVIGAYANKDYQTALKGIEDHIGRDPNAPGKFVFDRDGMGNITFSDGKASGKYIGPDGKVIRAVTETPDNFVAGFNARVNPSGYLAGQADARKSADKQAEETAKRQWELNMEQYKQSQQDKRSQRDNSTRIKVAQLNAQDGGTDSLPGSALVVAKLSPIYKNVKNAETAANILQTLQANPDQFTYDYIAAQKAAKQGMPAQQSDIVLWTNEAKEIAKQIGILPPDRAAPTAPGAKTYDIPKPLVPTSRTGVTKPAAKAISDKQRQSIVDNVLGGL